MQQNKDLVNLIILHLFLVTPRKLELEHLGMPPASGHTMVLVGGGTNQDISRPDPCSPPRLECSEVLILAERLGT